MDIAEWKALYHEWQENMMIALSLEYQILHDSDLHKIKLYNIDNISHLYAQFNSKCRMFETFFHEQFGHYEFKKELEN